MASIVFLDGEQNGSSVEITGPEVSLGRAKDNTITVSGKAVSSHHALIRATDNGLFAIDLDSTNGTYVNGKPTTESLLGRGDILTLGTTSIRIEGEELEPGENQAKIAVEAETPKTPVSVTETSSASDAELLETHPETRKVNIHPRTVQSKTPVPNMTAFGRKHDSRMPWIAVLVAIALVILVVLAWLILGTG